MIIVLTIIFCCFVGNSCAQLTLAKLETRVNVLEAEVKSLKEFKSSATTYCSLHAVGKCGPCLCKDDFNLPEKFYCDCQNLPPKRDCLEFYQQGLRIDGIYKVTMNRYRTTQVFCDQTTQQGGGWTVIQRRMDGSTNFYRNWQQYKVGFGQLHREFWLGNDNIHLLTLQASYPRGSWAMIDFKKNGVTMVPNMQYYKFQVDNEGTNYMLHVSWPAGSGWSPDFTNFNNKQEFSTHDKDNDGASSHNCARDFLFGGWWYNGAGNTCKSCQAGCTNLNGLYDEINQRNGSNRLNWHGDKLEFVEIKVRRTP